VDRTEITDKIKALALEAGFSKAGVAGVEPLGEAADRFEAWVASGAHGMMQWMERRHEERRNILTLMPDAKSILSLALNYYSPVTVDPDSDHKISRYAWGTDYHEVVPPMLGGLLEKIKVLAPGAEGRYYTDTGPILERELAQRSGIGWIGKHTNVITREMGSWVFLAEIILNIDLEPDTAAQDMCGTCTRCIDACPTDAITGPYQIDARKCIAYLTIELKPEHDIPKEFADKLEGWIYGCDICQDVCPWNRFAQPTAISEFAPREEIISLDSDAILAMEQEEFSKRFRKSPMKRARLAGLKRNILAAREATAASEK
jgi:epoxyqueuosine reductase